MGLVSSLTPTYRINDCYSCVQGEGVQTGVAMVLLRLHGCGVGCHFCDTKETWHVDEANRVGTLSEAIGTNPRWAEMEASQIAGSLAMQFDGPRWVLLTGGEPAEQKLCPLVRALQAVGFKVALETSGTATGHLGVPFDWVCVSPKIGMAGRKDVLVEAVSPADEIKMVIGKSDDIETLDRLLERVTLKPGAEICLQPMSGSPKATDLCVETAIARGWRVSIQVHRLIGRR